MTDQTEPMSPPGGERRGTARAEPLAQQWTTQVRAQLLAAWSASDDSRPMPSGFEALGEARRRVGVLLVGLGPLTQVDGYVLDIPQAAGPAQWAWLVSQRLAAARRRRRRRLVAGAVRVVTDASAAATGSR